MFCVFSAIVYRNTQNPTSFFCYETPLFPGSLAVTRDSSVAKLCPVSLSSVTKFCRRIY